MLRSLVTIEPSHGGGGAAAARPQSQPPLLSSSSPPPEPKATPAAAAADPISPPTPPAKAVPRIYPSMPHRPSSIELARMPPTSSSSSRPAGPSRTTTSSTTISSPTSDPDLEMSRPSSPTQEAETEAIHLPLPSISSPSTNRPRLASVSLINLGNGLNDSAPGALIPYISAHHSLGYAVTSLIFVANCLGFITGATVLSPLRSRLGRSGVLLLAQSLISCGYIPIVVSPNTPFPVVVACFYLTGLGMALNLAMANIFCGSLCNGTTALGIMHGSYGVGGTVGPLIATAIVTTAGANLETGEGVQVWARYYFVPLVLAMGNGAFAWWAFRGYEAELGVNHPLVVPAFAETTGRSGGDGSVADLAGALGSRVVLLGALFIFAYQGAEVSISGWVISFLMAVRGGHPESVGYVTAGFWAGITVGRLLLSGPGAHRLGERRFVYGLVVGSAVFEALVWSVPNVVGDAVAVSIVGLLLGPVYPCAAAVFMRSMGRAEKLSGMGVISAFGSSGGAAAPFTTGLLAQVAGTFVLHPIAIGLFAVMMVCWWAIPKERKRTE